MIDCHHCHHSEGLQHDCAYVDARNALIDEAEGEALIATAGCKLPLGSDERKRLADRTFHAAMDRLARERGIVG